MKNRIKIEDMVLPDGLCRFQNKKRPKVRFADKAKAEKALEQAQLKRAASGTGHVEKRVYPCPEGGCGGWHLSSRETFDEGIRIHRHTQFKQQTKNKRLAEIRAEKESS